ncbi:glycosyltransferase [Coleofasciculus sp. E2-BRE-01]|uniref:glycosyltransferase n=1 Tax=Coleofasciculus sp. E2-BRE-01 TaxID=3069524 RepID=UPI0033033C26
MNNHLSIDLIICTYNNAALLDRTLIAISEQQVPSEVEWNVLVVNNNCTDDTVAVVERHIQSGKLPNLSMVLEPQQGLTPARLCGVKNTTADWLAFVDDDCLLEEDWIAQAAKFALVHPECGGFGGRVILDWETPPPAFVLNYAYSFAQQEHGTLAKQMSCLVGAGLIINRSALIDIGWIDKQFLADRVGKKLISGGDVELALRLAAKYDLWYNPECKLRHIIPSWRTSETYLMKINYSLGTCKLYGDSMVWSGSYLAWLFVSVWDAFGSSLDILIQALRVVMGRRAAIEVGISSSFIRGWWVGIWSMLQMNVKERRELLGCAKLTVQ